MLLAAGLGTRLRPLTDRLPKPAVPLMGRPLAHYAIDRLLAAGVDRLAANAHHLAEHTAAVVRARVPEVVVNVERELLGTGGGVRAALFALAEREGRPIVDDEPFVVSNADVLFAVDLPAALARHRAEGAFATMVLRPDPRAEKLGPVEIDASGRVRRLLRLPESVDVPLSTMMFTGLSILSGRAVRELPENGCSVRQGFRRWLDRGELVLGVVDAAPFRDLGTPAEYLAAHLDLMSGAVPWPGVTPASVVVDPTATIAGATLDRVFVGAGAHIDPGVSLSRAVVWPSAVVRSSDHDVILFDGERLSAV
jgi:mannose-1-phosphate guanylyltransferase